MERAPRVHIRISEMLGRKPRDVKTPEAWWETWHAQTRPAFPRSFLLAGREGVCSALAAALARPAHQVITVLGPSSTEALAVVCACLVSDDGEAADETGTQALVVSDAHAWDRLVDSDHALVLIPTFGDADVSAALRRGHHVVVPVADDVPPRGIAVEVPPLDRWKAAEALLAQDNALSRDAADRYAGHARRNLISFRRTIAVTPAVQRPPWAEGPAVTAEGPCTSAGRPARGSGPRTRTPHGLLRQYFPKGIDLRAHGPGDLAAVAAELNARPRKTLGWDTPPGGSAGELVPDRTTSGPELG